jgi:hypothetical protein
VRSGDTLTAATVADETRCAWLACAARVGPAAQPHGHRFAVERLREPQDRRNTNHIGQNLRCARYSGDAEHGESAATVTQVVQDAAALLAILRSDVTGVGPGTSLASKIQDATTYASGGDTVDPCRPRGAFLTATTSRSLLT